MLKDIKHESTDTSRSLWFDDYRLVQQILSLGAVALLLFNHSKFSCVMIGFKGSFYNLILCLDIRPLRANHVSLHDLYFVFVMPAIVVL